MKTKDIDYNPIREANGGLFTIQVLFIGIILAVMLACLLICWAV